MNTDTLLVDSWLKLKLPHNFKDANYKTDKKLH